MAVHMKGLGFLFHASKNSSMAFLTLLYDLRLLAKSIWTQGVKAAYRREYWAFFGTLIRRYRNSPAKM